MLTVGVSKKPHDPYRVLWVVARYSSHGRAIHEEMDLMTAHRSVEEADREAERLNSVARPGVLYFVMPVKWRGEIAVDDTGQ